MNSTEIATSRDCCGCGQTKPASEFGTCKYKSGKIALKSRCRACRNADAKMYLSRLPKEVRQERKKKQTYTKYGITAEQYSAMLSNQDGSCAGCSRKVQYNLYIDHDHACCQGNQSCGRCVRGLLCFECNSALGLLKDNLSTLGSLCDYLGLRTLDPDE